LIRFHTKNIDPELYERLIRMFVYDMLDSGYNLYWSKWRWDIYSSADAPDDPFFDGKEGVGGVTGMGTVKLYLEDKKTNIMKDIFRRVLRQNYLVISHEGSHSLLIHMKKNHKVALRNADWSGHPKGTKLNFSTAEVHDRHVEGRFKNLSIWIRQGWNWYYLRNMPVVDIDDLV
jgi:hypothetical protein